MSLSSPQRRLGLVGGVHQEVGRPVDAARLAGGAQRPQGLIFRLKRRAPGDDCFNMRTFGKRFFRQFPQILERRIVQPQPAVAREDRNRFGEVVERFALHPDQGVVSALEVEPLGDVIEQIGHAAFGIRRRHHAQRAPGRQVPEVLA